MKQFKRAAIFAHYDIHGIIDDYVLVYLNKIKPYYDYIFFISDCDVKNNELEKIQDIIFFSLCKRHSEYDFGSYRIGFNILKNSYPKIFKELDEITFLNDSCYCVGDFKTVFEDNRIPQDCDAWSLGDDYAKNDFKVYYLQSYFITLRSNIFKKEFFQKFFNEMELKNKTKKYIVSNCEVKLSSLFIQNNLKIFAVFSSKEVINFSANNYNNIYSDIQKFVSMFCKNSNQIISELLNFSKLNFIHSDKFYLLLLMEFPLLKRVILSKKNFKNEKITYFWKEILVYKFLVEPDLILKNLKRLKIKEKKPYDIFDKKCILVNFVNKIISFLFRNKKTKSGFIIKIANIPVFHSKWLKFYYK